MDLSHTSIIVCCIVIPYNRSGNGFFSTRNLLPYATCSAISYLWVECFSLLDCCYTLVWDNFACKGLYGLRVWRDLYRVTPAGTRDLGFCGVVLQTSPIQLPFITKTGYRGLILTRIHMGRYAAVKSEKINLFSFWGSLILIFYSVTWESINVK